MSLTADYNASPGSCVLQHYIHPLCQSALVGEISADAFWQQIAQSGAPLIEIDPDHSDYSLVTFVFRNDHLAQHICVENRFGQPVEQQMTPIEGTDILYLSYRFENDTRLTYAFAKEMPLVNMATAEPEARKSLLKFLEHAQLLPDPFNPQRFDESRSLLALENSLADDYAKKRDGIERGWLHEEHFASEILGNERSIWIYTPAGYDRSDETYPVLLLLDGGGQIGVGHTHRILDNLIADEKIPPVIAVFIDNADAETRNVELPCSELFAEFIEVELTPWLYHHFPIRSLPTDWYVTGVSYGGLASLWLAYKMPHQIGNVISQSGSFWWGTGFRNEEKMNPSSGDYDQRSFIKELACVDHLPLRIWLEVGKLEAEVMLESNRVLRDLLIEKQVNLVYHEFGGTHHFSHWQTSLPLALVQMMGTAETP
tara:strand:+ start:20121 stop:21401 length:1281 start_codon:yes stop_codon:yes gene_type:complete